MPNQQNLNAFKPKMTRFEEEVMVVDPSMSRNKQYSFSLCLSFAASGELSHHYTCFVFDVWTLGTDARRTAIC